MANPSQGGSALPGRDGRAGRTDGLRTYRPTWAPFVGGTCIAVSLLLLVDLARRGTAHQIVSGVMVLGAVDLGAYLFGLQPCVVERPDGVEVVNPLRRVRLRWADLRDVYVRDVLVLVTDLEKIRCAGVTGESPSSRGRRSLGRRAFPGAPQPPPDTEPRAAEDAVTRLTARWEAAGGPAVAPGEQPPPRLTWFPPSLVLLGVAVAMLAAAWALGR